MSRWTEIWQLISLVHCGVTAGLSSHDALWEAGSCPQWFSGAHQTCMWGWDPHHHVSRVAPSCVTLPSSAFCCCSLTSSWTSGPPAGALDLQLDICLLTFFSTLQWTSSSFQLLSGQNGSAWKQTNLTNKNKTKEERKQNEMHKPFRRAKHRTCRKKTETVKTRD